MLIHLALAFALFETLALAGVLLAWADRVAGARLLAAFLTGIAVWIVGNELPNWFGQRMEHASMALLATAPLTSSFFFHFVVVFCGVRVNRFVIAGGYALACCRRWRRNSCSPPIWCTTATSAGSRSLTPPAGSPARLG